VSCCAPSAGILPNAGLAEQARDEEIRRGGRRNPDGTVHYSLSVPPIHCGQCMAAIERSVERLPGVASVRVNLSLRRVAFVLENAARSPMPVIEKLAELGYPATPLEAEAGADATTGELLAALAVAGFASANIMLLSVSVWSGADGATRDLFHLISALIAIPAVIWAGRPFYRSAFRALRAGHFNMDVPISLAVFLSLTISIGESLVGAEEAWFDASVTLLFFLLIGRTLDQVMRARARDGVTRLARLSGKGAFVVGADRIDWRPLDEIEPGMRLRIAAGDRLPVNGRIVEGSASFDRSLVTGESAPVAAGPGAELESGVLNLTGPVDIVATSDANTSFLAEIQSMMEAAEHGRGHYVRIADRLARLYAPMVHLAAAIAFVAWLIATGGDWHRALLVATAVLIVTCPCALGLAVPVAHVVSASRLFGLGILMRDGSALERLAEANRALFDKTGTLTTGQPTVESCEISGDIEQRTARALARRSHHPAAAALARHLGGGFEALVEAVKEHPGLGIEAVFEGRTVRLGRAEWVAEIAGDAVLSPAGTAFCLAGRPLRPVVLSETLRPGAATIAADLRKLSIASEIVSGDHAGAVARIGEACLIGSRFAGLMPAEKIDRFEQLRRDGVKALFVGDGLNDSPALAAAHVSFAPAEASDISRQAADFVFTRGDLAAVEEAIGIARATNRIIRQNFALALAYNLIAVPLAFAGNVTPLIAALAMSSSSIVVVANSMRLKWIGRRRAEKSAAATPAAANPAWSGAA